MAASRSGELRQDSYVSQAGARPLRPIDLHLSLGEEWPYIEVMHTAAPKLCEHVAVLPVRAGENGLPQIMLLTSRKTKRIIMPSKDTSRNIGLLIER